MQVYIFLKDRDNSNRTSVKVSRFLSTTLKSLQNLRFQPAPQNRHSQKEPFPTS